MAPDRWFRSTAWRVILCGATAATIAGLVYLTTAEYFFFEEFDARFNLVAYDYLAYPTEVFIDIWDAYPVAKAFKPRPTRSRRTATTDLSCRFRGCSH